MTVKVELVMEMCGEPFTADERECSKCGRGYLVAQDALVGIGGNPLRPAVFFSCACGHGWMER